MRGPPFFEVVEVLGVDFQRGAAEAANVAAADVVGAAVFAETRGVDSGATCDADAATGATDTTSSGGDAEVAALGGGLSREMSTTNSTMASTANVDAIPRST